MSKSYEDILEYFKLETIEKLEAMRGYEDGKEISELHNYLWNEDYFIIGTYKAEKWLEEFPGTFEAIRKIQQYEKENFGEVNTRLDDPESVANMYAYILGEEALQESKAMQRNWDKKLTPHVLESIIKDLKAE